MMPGSIISHNVLHDLLQGFGTTFKKCLPLKNEQKCSEIPLQ